MSSGFSPHEAPDKPRADVSLLLTETRYWYWFEIANEPIEGAIEEKPIPIDFSDVPEQAELDVVLFSLDEGIRVDSSAQVGKLQLAPGGAIVVLRQPSEGEDKPRSKRLANRLFFPVRTTQEEGRFRLRANLYYQQVLIQSRLVQVQVSRSPQQRPDALVATVDYSVSLSLDAARLSLRQGHRLSLMMNDAGDGSHGFMFFGSDGEPFVCPARLTEFEIETNVERARKRLRFAAYGSDAPWEKGYGYRYLGAEPDRTLLQEDLVALARSGRRILGGIESRLACQTRGEVGAVERLHELMRTPGLVEITSASSPSLMVPAALLYDSPLDDGISELMVCQAFLEALDGDEEEDLEFTECFRGACPNWDNDRVVCPSGFWGYRHELGLPSTLSTETRTGATEGSVGIVYGEGLIGDIALSADPELRLRDGHVDDLKEAFEHAVPSVAWRQEQSRDAVFDLFRRSAPQIVYFYCHGGYTEVDRDPYLGVGVPGVDDAITTTNVRDKGFHWETTRPLVFINGCHTAALEPEQALNFVSAFVEATYASGVIGTEVAIFEPLATWFAQEFFSRFISGSSVGRAIRGARLALLKKGNPLGLVYIPFVAPDIKLRQIVSS